MDAMNNIMDGDRGSTSGQEARDILIDISFSMIHMKEGREACGILHHNLTLIFSELDQLNESNRLPSQDIMNLYYNTLCNVQNYLRQHSKKDLLYRRKNFETMKFQMKQLINDVNQLAIELNVQDLNYIEGWEEHWREGLSNAELENTIDIIQCDRVFTTLHDARDVLNDISVLMVHMEEGRDTCGKLHENLSLIHSDIDRFIDSNRLLSQDIMNLYYNTLCNVQSYLLLHSKRNILYRRKNFETMKLQMGHFVNDLKKLATVLSVNSGDLQDMTGWEEHWSMGLAKHCENKDAVLNEVLHVRKHQESHTNEMCDIKTLIQKQTEGNIWHFNTLKSTLISVLSTNLSSSHDNHQQSTRTGSIHVLMDMVRDESSNEKEKVAEMFMNMSAHYDHVKKFADINTMKRLIEWLKNGSDKQKEYIVMAMKNLAQNSMEHRKLIVEAGGIIPLVDMLKSNKNEHKLIAAMTLWILVGDDDNNRTLIYKAGAIDALYSLLRSGRDEHKSYATEIIWHLAKDDRCRKYIERLGINPETGEVMQRKRSEREAGTNNADGVAPKRQRTHLVTSIESSV